MQAKKRWMKSAIETARTCESIKMPWTRGEHRRAVVAARARTARILSAAIA